jgi:hypothetical protein
MTALFLWDYVPTCECFIFEIEAKRRGGARLPNQHANIDANNNLLILSTLPWELVDCLPHRIFHPLAQVGWKVLFTTPTTCNSSRGNDYDKADDDNYSSSSSGWDNGSHLAERLEQSSLSLVAAAASVTSNKEEEKKKYPPCFAMDGNKTQRIGAVVSIDGPFGGEGGGVIWTNWQQTNNFEFNDLNSDIHRPPLTVLPMINVQCLMKRGRKNDLREGDHCWMTKD